MVNKKIVIYSDRNPRLFENACSKGIDYILSQGDLVYAEPLEIIKSRKSLLRISGLVESEEGVNYFFSLKNPEKAKFSGENRESKPGEIQIIAMSLDNRKLEEAFANLNREIAA